MRLKNHLERLAQRHILEIAAEGAGDFWIRHHAQARIAHEKLQQICDWRRVRCGQGYRPRAVQIVGLLALVELRHRERPKRWLRRLRRALTDGQKQRKAHVRTDSHTINVGAFALKR